ncbi:MAG: PAS domain S-box protein [Gammaproteobacteria bacterium]|nr:PAS domain S-box protein [Gammaproteobacteria bacterium]
MNTIEQNRIHLNAHCHGVLRQDIFISCSDGFADWLGLQKKFIKGKSILDFSPKYQSENYTSAEELQRRIAACERDLPQNFLWRLCDPQGEVVTCLLSLQRQANNPDAENLVLEMKPLRETPQGESFEHSTHLLKQMLKNASSMVYVRDHEGSFHFVNREFATAFGLKEKQILGRSIYEVFSPELAQTLIENDRRIFISKKPMEFEERIEMDGLEHTFSTIKFPLFDDQKQVYAVCGIATDITAQKKTADAFKSVALGVSGSSFDNVFDSIVTHLAETIGVEFAFIGQYQEDNTVSTVSVFHRGQILPNMVYDLDNTPCDGVVGKDFLLIPKQIQQLYPGDTMLSQLELNSYAGFPLFDSSSMQLGLISIGSQAELVDTQLVRSIMEIFSIRASAELERLRVDQARRVSEESYRSIFEASEDGILVVDIDNFEIVDMNPRACSDFSCDKSKFVKRSIFELQVDEDNDNACDLGQTIKAALCGAPQQITWQRQQRFWDEVSIKRVTIAGVERLLFITSEITEKKLAEDKLRSSEELYRVIFNSSIEGLVVFDEAGQIIDVNPMFKIMHGYNLDDDFSHITPADVIPADYIPVYKNYIQTVLNEGRAHIVGAGKKKDGSRSILDIHGVRMYDLDQVKLLTIIRDVTEQQLSEQALKLSENRLRATFEAALDAIIGIDEQGKIIEFNPAAEACFGYRRNQVIGRSLADMIIPTRFRKAHEQGMKHYLASNEGPLIGQRIEVDAMRQDGSEFVAELAIDVTEGAEGKIFIGYLRDITERKNAEEARTQLEAQLRQAQKMETIGHLTGGIAHDFNNILTSTMGNIMLAEDLAKKYQDEKLEKYFSRAIRSGEKARNLIQQMLTFSRGQRGDPVLLCLAPIIKETMKLLEASLPSSVEIEISVPDTLSRVMIDPVHLEQVLVNLCVNARDAVNQNGKIHLELYQHENVALNCDACRQSFQGSFVSLKVSDNGCGMEPNVMDRMFEPFYSTKEVGKGSGMGLSTVHGIVHDYNGHIKVESSVGKGSSIQVFFHAEKAESLSGEDAKEQLLRTTSNETHISARVLLIDDEDDVLEFMFDMLETWGIEVLACSSSTEALQIFMQQSEALDLVITDNTMPKITGSELIKQFHQINSQIPMILYTGYRQDIDEDELANYGVKQVLDKPIDLGQMKQLLQKLLS